MFERAKQQRHPLYQNISLALTHQSHGNHELALAYWKQAAKFAPSDFPLKFQVVQEYTQIIQDLLNRKNRPEAQRVRDLLAKFEPNFEALRQEDAQASWQPYIYLASVHQCLGHYPLSFAYWKRVIAGSSPESAMVLRGMEDFCWIANQHWKKGEIREAKEIYRNLVEVHPQFLEGYVNLSLIYYNTGEIQNAISLLERFEVEHKENLLISKYLELYKSIEELKSHFDNVPYAAVERIVEQIQVENIFYPFVQESYLALLVKNIIEREKRSFEKRRLEAQEKAISISSKALAKEGVSLGERIAMARNANPREIPRFLHDTDPKIIEALLTNPHLTEEDVLILAQTSKISEILDLVAHHFKWSTRHRVLLAIVCNPQIDPARSKKLLPSLRLKDLTVVFHRKKVPAEVRLEAKRLAREIFIGLAPADQVAVIEASSGDILRILDRLPPESLKFLDLVLERFLQDLDIMLNLSRWWEAPGGLLEKIGESPHWQGNPQIRFALLTNPRTPPHLVLKLLRDLEADELKWMAENKALPPYTQGVIEKIIQDLP